MTTTAVDDLRVQPIRKLHVSFQAAALPPGAVLAVSVTWGGELPGRVRLLFAHYREGRTWPPSMSLDEPKRDEVRGDGKRVVGRFQSGEKAIALVEELDETDLRDLPAAFTLDPRGAVPPLSVLDASGASFDVTLLPELQGGEARSVARDLDLRVTALYGAEGRVTLFRTLDSRSAELADAELQQRRERIRTLLGAPEAALSPEERRSVARLRHAEAQRLVSRAFGMAPPPAAARRKLYAEAIEACEAVLRLLQPLVAEAPRFHDVGMAYWAASNLALFHETAREPERARQHGETALRLVEAAAAHSPDEPEFARWVASARERLRRAGRS